MDDGRIVGRKLYGQLTLESGISGISGLSGLSGRWRPDGRRVYMGTLHRRSEKPVQVENVLNEKHTPRRGSLSAEI